MRRTPQTLWPTIRRLLSTDAAPPSPAASVRTEKGFSFSRLLFGSLLVSTASVTGAIALSAENPQFRRLLTDSIPLPATEWLGEGEKQYFKLKSIVHDSIGFGGEKSMPVQSEEKAKSPSLSLKNAESAKKPLPEANRVSKPPVALEFQSVEDAMQYLTRTLCRLAVITKQLETGTEEGQSPVGQDKRQSIERETRAIAEHLQQNLAAVQHQINLRLSDASAKASATLAEQSSQFAHLLQAETARITDSITRELEAKHEQEKLLIIQSGEQSAQQRMAELEQRLHQFHQASLQLQSEQMQKDFDQRVQQLVEEERQGRLARLELLSAKLDLLERLTRAYVEGYGQSSRLHRMWSAYYLVRGAVESDERQSLRKRWHLLQEICKDEPLVETVLASIQPTVLDEGVYPVADLQEYLESIEGKLYRAGLAPEDGGLYALTLSYLFSLFRFRQQGHVEGDDVESIVARSKYFLAAGDLRSATRELNNLNGWSRRLASDFLDRCRRRLEVQQALDAVEAHLGHHTLSVSQPVQSV